MFLNYNENTDFDKKNSFNEDLNQSSNKNKNSKIITTENTETKKFSF